MILEGSCHCGATRCGGKRYGVGLVYGETGESEKSLELIDVNKGYPEPGKFLWRFSGQVTGGFPEVRQVAELCCATVEDMRWSAGELRYRLVGPDAHCAALCPTTVNAAGDGGT